MKKILIVDDEESIQEMLRRVLEHDGHLVITAGKGQTALQWLRETRLDLAIVDLGLPDISGMEVCRAIKEDPRTRCIPVIILTGDSSNGARIAGNLCNSVELFLNKPVSIDDLKKAVALSFEKADKKKLLLRNSVRSRLEN